MWRGYSQKRPGDATVRAWPRTAPPDPRAARKNGRLNPSNIDSRLAEQHIVDGVGRENRLARHQRGRSLHQHQFAVALLHMLFLAVERFEAVVERVAAGE